MFLLHPTLTKQALTIFQCTKVDDGEQRVTIDMTIACYSYTHIFWCLVVGFPMIIFWVFGAPLLVLFILIRNREHLQEPFMKRYFLVLYQGLKKKAFYWEFVNTIRKILMPAFNVVLSTVSSFYRAMVSVIILVILFRIQQHIHPYKMEENNQIEMLAVITGTVTLFGAILFVDENEKDVEFLKLYSLIVILLTNTYFILRWIHLLLYTFKFQNPTFLSIRKMVGVMLIRNKDDYLLSEYHSTTKSVSKSKETKRKKSTGKKKRFKKKLKNKHKKMRKVKFSKRSHRAQPHEEHKNSKEKSELDVVYDIYELENAKESFIDSSSNRDNAQDLSVRELLKDRRIMEKIKSLNDDELNYVNVFGAKHKRTRKKQTERKFELLDSSQQKSENNLDSFRLPIEMKKGQKNILGVVLESEEENKNEIKLKNSFNSEW